MSKEENWKDAMQIKIGRIEVNCFDEDSEMSIRVGNSKYESLIIEDAQILADYLLYHINLEKTSNP